MIEIRGCLSMSTEKRFTEHDVELAKKIGELTVSVNAINNKVDMLVTDIAKQIKALWDKSDKHSSMIYWILGLGGACGMIAKSLIDLSFKNLK